MCYRTTNNKITRLLQLATRHRVVRAGPPGKRLGALAPLGDQVIAANAAKADEYRAGKTGLVASSWAG
jgi:hypothetical protein